MPGTERQILEGLIHPHIKLGGGGKKDPISGEWNNSCQGREDKWWINADQQSVKRKQEGLGVLL